MWKMAFRNIFRNRRRTFFTILSTMLGTAGIIFAMSYIEGFSQLIEKAIKATGHIRVTDKDYALKSRVFDTSSNVNSQELNRIITKNENVKSTESIIKFAAYAFTDKKDTKIMGLGIENERSAKKYLVKGKFIDKEDKNKIVIGKKIANKLNLDIGKDITLVVNTQFFSTYALNYEIVGIINEATLDSTVFLNIEDARYLLDMEGRSSELLITLKDKNSLEQTKKSLTESLKKYNVELKSYNEIGFASAMELYKIMKFILAIIMGFLSSIAIFNTMVMSVFERKKEIGVIKALGMEEKDIKKLLCLEGLIIGSFGAFGGIMLGSAGSLYFQFKGIYLGTALDNVSSSVNFGDTIYTKLTFQSLVVAVIIAIVVSLIASFLPVKKEVKKEITENLSSKVR